MRKQTVADLLAKTIESEGIPYVFGVPGGQIMPLLQALGERC